MATVKKCSKCQEVKALEEFSPNYDNKDGYKGQCKVCRNLYESKRNFKKREPAATKTCTVCRIEKSSSLFPRHRRTADGLSPWCKECSCKKSAEARNGWTKEEREQYRAYSREHSRTPSARVTQKKSREKQKASGKRKIYVAAFMAVVYAVYHGKLKRPDSCEANGKYGPNCQLNPVQPHHYKGYDKENWLDIEWLCRSCHRIADRQRSKNGSV